ncbi:MAG TPA: signal peptidase I, partial [Dehalococcoidia bacterium]|nr:signal peptidase I [Dehalococcoidia bacterium]
MSFSLVGKDALKYAELLAVPANLHWIKTAVRRGLIYGSAAVLAIVISGGVFSLTPLFGVSLVHTQGTSMEPDQKDGDVVLLQDIKGAQAKVGDVVVFEERGHGIMHRVIQRFENERGELVLVTQGDNVPVPDH